jgi:DNA adenine methylase
MQAQSLSQSKASIPAKPFLKWAGGKSQLLAQFQEHFPSALREGRIRRYVEPFIGGGAVFFHVAQRYDVREFIISDVNPEIILCYRTVREAVEPLIATLQAFQREYDARDAAARERMFYDVRARLNRERGSFDLERFEENWIGRTAQLLFLNRTCFNGLFRLNSKGEFNVPFGKYANPGFCDARNLRAASEILRRTEIRCGDFEGCADAAGPDAFFYLDPPYRPLNQTSSFTSYARGDFGDAEQVRLAAFCRRLDAAGAKFMASNSDPKNENPQDDFFERLYEGFTLLRVFAARAINAQSVGRGAIAEIVVKNY